MQTCNLYGSQEDDTCQCQEVYLYLQFSVLLSLQKYKKIRLPRRFLRFFSRFPDLEGEV